MIVQADDIFAVLENEAVASAKEKFAKMKAEKSRFVEAVIARLSPSFDQVVTEKSLYFAVAEALEVRASFTFLDGMPPQTPLMAVISGGASGAFSNLNKYVDEKIGFNDPPEKVIKRYELNKKAAAAYIKGATIGELFLLQPNLFV